MSAADLRRQIAARTPDFVRKRVRMAEHYGRRHKEWLQVLREMRGARSRDTLTLLCSALLAPLTSLRRLDGFEPPLPLADLTVEARGVGRFKLRAGTDDIIHVLSAREPAVRRLLEDTLNPGDTFVDAGANIGFFSVLASRLVGPKGKVVAIEMMPETAARLRHHLALNHCTNAVVVEHALSERGGEIVRATSSAKKFGQASIAAGVADNAERSIVHEVETVTLDAALTDCGAIALIKMDLEGAELLALRGANAVLARTRVMVFENNVADPKVPALLAAAGFAVAPLDGANYLANRLPSGLTDP